MQKTWVSLSKPYIKPQPIYISTQLNWKEPEGVGSIIVLLFCVVSLHSWSLPCFIKFEVLFSGCFTIDPQIRFICVTAVCHCGFCFCAFRSLSNGPQNFSILFWGAFPMGSACHPQNKCTKYDKQKTKTVDKSCLWWGCTICRIFPLEGGKKKRSVALKTILV